MPPSDGQDAAAAPLPSRSADSESCASPPANRVLSGAPTDSQPFSAQNGRGAVSLGPAASDAAESLQPALLPGQPLVYVPSAPLFMLCGGLQEAPAPGAGPERDSRGWEVTAAEHASSPSVPKRLGEERRPQEEEGPATKRQSRDCEEGPLSLVMPKVRGFA